MEWWPVHNFEKLPATAVIVTRGDVDLAPVLASLRLFDDVVVWDNSQRPENVMVFGRYAAVRHARYPIIYTQDDDCIVDAAAIVNAYEPGYVVCNMPAAKRREYETLAPGVALVGWGACFDLGALAAFETYQAEHARDDLFYRECDRVFTALNPQKLVDVPVTHLPHAAVDRMGNEPRHLTDLAEIRRRIGSLRVARDGRDWRPEKYQATTRAFAGDLRQ